MVDNGSVVVIGGTSEIGKRIAQRYADKGESVVVTSRDSAKAQAAAKEIGGNTSGAAVDLHQPEEIADALADLGPVKYLVIVAIQRDSNTVDEFAQFFRGDRGDYVRPEHIPAQSQMHLEDFDAIDCCSKSWIYGCRMIAKSNCTSIPLTKFVNEIQSDQFWWARIGRRALQNC